MGRLKAAVETGIAGCVPQPSDRVRVSMVYAAA